MIKVTFICTGCDSSCELKFNPFTCSGKVLTEWDSRCPFEIGIDNFSRRAEWSMINYGPKTTTFVKCDD